MRVIGTGVDLVDIQRISSAIDKFGERFLSRIFTDNEVFYCQSMKYPARHLAARFAAKEAVSKALGTGIGNACGWKDIEVVRRESGSPDILLWGAGKGTAAGMGISDIHISLSHTDTHAVATAVASGE
jgi:holo-[acyl-carrier protein] synthase